MKNAKKKQSMTFVSKGITFRICTGIVCQRKTFYLLDASNFSKSSNDRHGFKVWCMNCCSEYSKQKRIEKGCQPRDMRPLPDKTTDYGTHLGVEVINVNGTFEVLIDKQDLPLLERATTVRVWNSAKTNIDNCNGHSNRWYCQLLWKKKGAPLIQKYLHREILGMSKGDGLVGHHINNNSLDNRRLNLETCTPKENCAYKHARIADEKRKLKAKEYRAKYQARQRADNAKGLPAHLSGVKGDENIARNYAKLKIDPRELYKGSNRGIDQYIDKTQTKPKPVRKVSIEEYESKR